MSEVEKDPSTANSNAGEQALESTLAEVVFSALSRQAKSHANFGGDAWVRKLVDEIADKTIVEEIIQSKALRLLRDGAKETRDFRYLSELCIQGWLNQSSMNESEFGAMLVWLDLASGFDLLGAAMDNDAARPRAEAALNAYVSALDLSNPKARAYARYVGIEADAEADETTLSGRVCPAPLSFSALTLANLSGYSALKSCWHALARVSGWKHVAQIETDREGITLTSHKSWLGKTFSEHTMLIPWHKVDSIEVFTRGPRLVPSIATFAFALGALLGTYFLFQGGRSGDSYALMIGVGLWILGAGSDLLARWILPSLKQKAFLRVRSELRSLWLGDMPKESVLQIRDTLKQWMRR